MSQPNPGLVWDTFTAHQRTAALRAAVELNLFGALSEGHKTAAAIAQRCGVPERGMRILCDYLVIAGLVNKTANEYSHTPTSAVFLAPDSPASMAPTMPFMLNAKILRASQLLTETIRLGRTALEEPLAGEEVKEWVTFAQSMHPMMAAAADFMAAVGSRRGAPARVLDIAASHGLFGMAFARRAASTMIVAQDFASVLDVTREKVTTAGLAAQYEFLPGSAFSVDLGAGYDVILVTNLYHHFDMPTCQTLMRRFHTALSDGGVMLTLEMVPDEDRISPPAAAAFSMMMLANTPAGDAFTMSEYQQMLRNAGFGEIEKLDVPQSPQQLVVAVK
ncbi:MAG: class I SAM-dependent methyltransferase [Bryobacterales bacterium]|nr:class I SAM-dependent methyltransferase [Bryobacterales bacterium]